MMGGRAGFAIRDGELRSRLDGVVQAVNAERRGRRLTREALARELLHDALDDPRTARKLGVRRLPTMADLAK